MLIREKLLGLAKRLKTPEWIMEKLYAIYGEVRNLELYFKYGDKYFFRNAAIEISTYCNRGCSYCPNSKYPTLKKLMDEKLYKKVISRLKEIDFNGSLYFHFYNEPLLDKRLADLIVMAKKELPGATVRIFTNGDILTIEMAKKLIEAGVSEFVVSEHVPTTKTWGENMKAIKDKFPTYFNVQSLKNKVLSNRGGLVTPTKQITQANCLEPLRTLQIDYLGNVILCCNDFFRAHNFGNLQDKSILTIWNGKEFAKVRKDLREGRIDYPMCRKCLNLSS